MTTTRGSSIVEGRAKPLAAIWRFTLATGWFIPVAFLLFLLWRAPHLDPADWDYDEGINLMKSLLVNRGLPLYTVVWNDQPPILTMLLSAVFGVTEQSVMWGRTVIMVLSSVLLWCFYLVAHRSVSALAATVAVVLLVASEFYIRLSGAVMVGLPAVALAMVSVALLLAAKQRWWMLALSGIVMAFALQTKLMAGFVIPAMFVHMIWGEDSAHMSLSWRRRFSNLVIWGAAVVVPYVAIGIYYQALRPDLLISPHLRMRTRDTFIEEGAAFFGHYLQVHAVYLMVAMVGVVWAMLRRKRGVLLPLIWFLTSFVTLLYYRPIWYHHVVLLNVPLAWLTAFGIEAWLDGWRQVRRWRLAGRRRLAYAGLAASAFAMLAILWVWPKPFNERLDEQMAIYRPLFVWDIQQRLIDEAAVQGGWIFTDRPYYAFRANTPVIPTVAVLSRKRMEAGIITDEIMLAGLQEYEPTYVLTERFTGGYGATIMDEITAHYDLMAQNNPAVLYKRRTE